MAPTTDTAAMSPRDASQVWIPLAYLPLSARASRASHSPRKRGEKPVSEPSLPWRFVVQQTEQDMVAPFAVDLQIAQRPTLFAKAEFAQQIARRLVFRNACRFETMQRQRPESEWQECAQG